MQTHRDIPFADGEYTVRLGMAQIFAIQEKTGRGIGEVYARVMEGRMQGDGFHFGYGLNARFSIEDLIEVCRQGLIGGGKGFVDGMEVTVSDHKATHLVRTYLHPESGNPISKAWDMATVILDAAWNGYEPAVAEAQKKSPTQTSGQAGSTEGEQSETA